MLTVIQPLDMNSRDLSIDMAQERSAFELHQEMRNAMGMTGTKSSRRPPHKTTETQKRILLAEFEKEPNPSAERRDELARELNVERRIIKNWFSNQRALRRKTGQGYRGWAKSPSQSDDDREVFDIENRDYNEDFFPRIVSIPPPPSYTEVSSRASSYPPSPPPLSPPQITFQNLDSDITDSASIILPEPLVYPQSTSTYPFDLADGPHLHPVITSYRKPYMGTFLSPSPAFSGNISAPASQDDMETDSDSEADTPHCSGVVYHPISAVRSTQVNQF